MPKFIALYAVLGIALAPIASGVPETGTTILATAPTHSSSTASKLILCYLFPKLPLCVNK